MKEVQVRQPKNIILAVDGSVHSTASAALLCDLPLPPGSTIMILAVIVPREASDYTACMALLNQAKAVFEGRQYAVKTELLTGYPSEMLTSYGEANPPDLMILGAKGLRATINILLGGVAQQLIEYAPWPVLVVRSPYHGLKRVLFATDGSKFSRCALDDIMTFPFPAETEIRAIHILPAYRMIDTAYPHYTHGAEVFTPYIFREAGASEEMNAILAEEEREGDLLMADTLSQLEKVFSAPVGVVRRGDAATEILDYIRDNKIDLVISGSRGLSRLKGLFLGSVSRKLAHYSSSSVMVVKGGSYGTN
ncbi:MAG: universal stress protein [Chloroflexi bacterium]|nr:MAG: universal stress protein [Chloroflexota bacterium]